jgi:myo-inositol-1-phosphate synthase
MKKPDISASERVGVWIVGARGSVATTVIAGAAALSSGLQDATGLVSETPPLHRASLPALDSLVFGGHDVTGFPLLKHAEKLAEGGVIPTRLLAAVSGALEAAESRVRPGFDPAGDEDPATAVDRVRTDIRSFNESVGADRVVVVNLSSTEPISPEDPAHLSWPALERALSEGREVLPPSSLYAAAAFLEGCSFIEFTPSTGPRLPALDELARHAGVPYAGADGKTGESLVRAALGPMFATRSLRVRSWSGTNILGGGDGATLADRERADSKLRSKTLGLQHLLGPEVETPLHIDYVADMGDWKTAWDHISFEGFLGVRMKMQFTWEGCDSALAAPLVIDLVRFIASAHRSGRSGAVPELGFFFKQPLTEDTPPELAAQYALLCRLAADLGA